MSRAPLPTTVAALALALVCSCQSESSGPTDTHIAPQVAGVEPMPVFEGLQKIALHFSGTDFSGVTAPPTFSVTSGNEPRRGDIEVTDWLCNNVRCGVALRLGKWLPGHGQALPSPIQGQQVRILFEGAANQISATLLVLPLDHGGGSSTSSPPHMTGTWMFYDFRLGVDVPLSVEPDATGLPGRILVTNEISLASGATIVASGLPGIAGPPAGGAAGPGGFPGAANGDDAALPMGGRAGSAPGAGGGGGGFGEAGSPGEGVDPAIGGEGGSAGQGVELDCLRANTAGCGGGGGGSAGSGEGGGGGGGGVLIVSLGTMDMAGNAIRSDGGDGAEGVADSGGGGGAGGAIGLGAVRFTGDGSLAALGGAGGAAGAGGGAGGSGGGGRVRIDSVAELPLAVDAASLWHGPAVDVAALDVVTPDAETTMTGRGEPGATIRVTNYAVRPAPFTETAVSADGTFTIVVPLLAGLNDLEVSQRAGGLTARSFTGTMFELSGRTVLGARIYIVRVPEVE